MGKGRGWHGEPGRHADAARGIKTANRGYVGDTGPFPLGEVRIREETRTGAKTLKRMQILADMLWFDKGFLSLEQSANIRKEMREIQRVIGEHHWDAGGRLHPVRPGQPGMFTEKEESAFMRQPKGKAAYETFRRRLRAMEDADLLPRDHWTFQDYYEDYLESGVTVKQYFGKLRMRR